MLYVGSVSTVLLWHLLFVQIYGVVFFNNKNHKVTAIPKSIQPLWKKILWKKKFGSSSHYNHNSHTTSTAITAITAINTSTKQNNKDNTAVTNLTNHMACLVPDARRTAQQTKSKYIKSNRIKWDKSNSIQIQNSHRNIWTINCVCNQLQIPVSRITFCPFCHSVSFWIVVVMIRSELNW